MTAAQHYVLAAIVSCAAVACFWGAVATCESGCSSAVSDAKAIQAPLAAGCAFLEAATTGSPEAPYVDFGCATAEAADALVAAFPAGQAIASTASDASPNGPPTAAFWRVHFVLRQADAGAP